MSALQRFASTRNVQDSAEAVRQACDAESDRLDSELAMVRYIAWAIPSIGFIGTVRGISQALGQAYKAVEGDISGVTAQPGRGLQLDLHSAGDQHRGDVPDAPVAVDTGTPGARRPGILRPAAAAAPAGTRFVILLELNDAALGLYRDGRTVYCQPPIAHVGAEQSRFGLEALRIARLHPQQATSNTWRA